MRQVRLTTVRLQVNIWICRKTDKRKIQWSSSQRSPCCPVQSQSTENVASQHEIMQTGKSQTPQRRKLSFHQEKFVWLFATNIPFLKHACHCRSQSGRPNLETPPTHPAQQVSHSPTGQAQWSLRYACCAKGVNAVAGGTRKHKHPTERNWHVYAETEPTVKSHHCNWKPNNWHHWKVHCGNWHLLDPEGTQHFLSDKVVRPTHQPCHLDASHTNFSKAQAKNFPSL